jgi:acyl-coenzyme A synthetase/AMP-(fatty) acid ligase
LSEAAPATIIGTVPPQHMYGFELTLLLPLHAPAASWCGPAFFPGDVHAALAAVPAPRILVTTPLQIRAYLHAGTGLPPIQAAISATAPLDPGLAAEAEARWRAPMLEIFGATEVGSIASRRTLDGDVWTAYPGVVVQQDEGVTLVSAPWAGPVELADQIEPLDTGRFRLLGRRSDVVKLGGHRASLSGLNRILTELEGVADGAFLVPDDLDQRPTARLMAVVVAPRRSASSILAELRGRVDPLFLPRRVICVDALPRNELGKLPRQALLALLARLDAPA